jgi:DNA-binding HxlR family transcriptional regulator
MSQILKTNSTNQANKKELGVMCRVNDVLALAGKRWLMTVLYQISQGKSQFSILRREISGISDHILASRLNELVTQGLATRTEVAGTNPPQIVYAVTAKGEQLLVIIDQLNKWSGSWESGR